MLNTNDPMVKNDWFFLWIYIRSFGGPQICSLHWIYIGALGFGLIVDHLADLWIFIGSLLHVVSLNKFLLHIIFCSTWRSKMLGSTLWGIGLWNDSKTSTCSVPTLAFNRFISRGINAFSEKWKLHFCDYLSLQR